jgi:hypothetical protein
MFKQIMDSVSRGLGVEPIEIKENKKVVLYLNVRQGTNNAGYFEVYSKELSDLVGEQVRVTIELMGV